MNRFLSAVLSLALTLGALLFTFFLLFAVALFVLGHVLIAWLTGRRASPVVQWKERWSQWSDKRPGRRRSNSPSGLADDGVQDVAWRDVPPDDEKR